MILKFVYIFYQVKFWTLFRWFILFIHKCWYIKYVRVIIHMLIMPYKMMENISKNLWSNYLVLAQSTGCEKRKTQILKLFFPSCWRVSKNVQVDEIFINCGDRKIFEISPNHFKFWENLTKYLNNVRACLFASLTSHIPTKKNFLMERRIYKYISKKIWKWI
jgi:hypothetical protein